MHIHIYVCMCVRVCVYINGVKAFCATCGRLYSRNTFLVIGILCVYVCVSQSLFTTVCVCVCVFPFLGFYVLKILCRRFAAAFAD